MQVSVVFSVDNAATHDEDGQPSAHEIRAILQEVAHQIGNREVWPANQVIRIKDAFGNRIGFAVMNEDGIKGVE